MRVHREVQQWDSLLTVRNMRGTLPAMAHKEHVGMAGSRVYHYAPHVTKAQRQAFKLPEYFKVDRFWLEVDFAPGWRAAYFLVPYGGQPVVAEVRIFPADEYPGRDAGAWRAQFLGVRAAPGVKLGAERKHAVALLKLLAPTWPDGARGFYAAPEGAASKRGQTRGRPDRFYAGLARDYVTRCSRGSRRPVADVAKRHKLAVSIVRDAIHEARARGLLSKGRQGAPGGQLTPLGLLRSRKGKGR